MSGIALSTKESIFTASTYWSSMMCSRLLSLLLPLLMILSLFPEKWFEKNEPIMIPITTHTAMMMGMKRLVFFLLMFIYLLSYVLGSASSCEASSGLRYTTLMPARSMSSMPSLSRYFSAYTTRLMPAWMMSLAHSIHGEAVT